ncbi:MAG: isoaspartyl peptidase/L-asparaginase family protein [Lysobacterales bacterium]
MIAAPGLAPPMAIALHAGAGTIERNSLPAETEREIRAALRLAVTSGYTVLTAGGSSLDAVTAAVISLEDSPHFNAGKGAVFNSAGKNELDASIMNGADLSAGAVAGVHNIRNPVLLARKIMSDSQHVMLAGEGAEEFAREHGIAFEHSEYFFTERRWQQLLQARASDTPQAHAVSESPDQWLSTVGAVALDSAGNLAAATSTGGTTNKRWGRVGDSPIIGAGTYADNRSCAVSATGHGEFFIRAAVAKDICARMQYLGISLTRAAEEVVLGEMVRMGGEGGVAALDYRGNITLPFNTPGMYRASVDATGNVFVGIYAGE